jgi:hypothetical protein
MGSGPVRLLNFKGRLNMASNTSSVTAAPPLDSADSRLTKAGTNGRIWSKELCVADSPCTTLAMARAAAVCTSSDVSVVFRRSSCCSAPPSAASLARLPLWSTSCVISRGCHHDGHHDGSRCGFLEAGAFDFNIYILTIPSMAPAALAALGNCFNPLL